MVGPIDVKQKGSTLVGYWVQYVTLTFDLTHDIDLGCFKVKFRNSSISRIVGLIDVKWTGNEVIWSWADCMTLSYNHTHDFDLGVSRSESEIALSQEWGGWLAMNEKMWVINSWPLYWLVWPWWVGLADVPDSDRGDFRCRRAVDISSFQCLEEMSHLLKRIFNVVKKWVIFSKFWNVCQYFVGILYRPARPPTDQPNGDQVYKVNIK